MRLICTATVLVALALPAPSARAAESYDNCTQTITSLPTTITTQGTWCMKSDLTTNLASGAAITVAASNVIIDCNHFKLGGLSAGLATQTAGIHNDTFANTTVRNCNIRGFMFGTYLTGNSGHVVEDNRFDGNTQIGLLVDSTGGTVRRNVVVDTGYSTVPTGSAMGILAYNGVDVIDNTVTGVYGVGTNGDATGIYTWSNGHGSVVGNRVRLLVAAGSGDVYGIYNYVSGRTIIEGNHLQAEGEVGSLAIRCSGGLESTSVRNVITGFESAAPNCQTEGDTVNVN